MGKSLALCASRVVSTASMRAHRGQGDGDLRGLGVGNQIICALWIPSSPFDRSHGWLHSGRLSPLEARVQTPKDGVPFPVVRFGNVASPDLGSLWSDQEHAKMPNR